MALDRVLRSEGPLGQLYFERLHQADPPAVELDFRGVAIPIADPPIYCGPHSFVETQAAVNRLKWGKAQGICGIHAELLKAGGNPVLMSLHAVLCCLEHKHHPQLTGRRALLSLSGKGRGIANTATTTEG